MIITINGEKKDVPENIILMDLLKQLSLEDKVMAAAVNMEIVKQDKWDQYEMEEGDILELLDFVGGG